jgi:hypothetical protein
LTAFAIRGVYPNASRVVAASIGAGAGSIGGLALHLHCRVADSVHLAVFHGGVVICAALLSAIIAPLILDLPWNLRRKTPPATTRSSNE